MSIKKSAIIKYLLLIIFIGFVHSIHAQRVTRFIDSLTLDQQRSWVDKQGVSFTNVGDNCSYGMEMTFYKEDNKVLLYRCDKGEWKAFNYNFEVVTENGGHFIKFFTRKTYFIFFDRSEEVKDFRIETQIISDAQGIYFTKLYFYNLNDKQTFTLTSK